MSKLKGLLLTEGLHGMISQVEGLAKALDLEYFHEKIELNNFWKLIPPSLTPVKKYIFKTIGKKVKKISIKNFWIVRQFNNEYNPIHYHDGHISGVGYLKIPKFVPKGHKKSKIDGTIDFINGNKMFLSDSIYNHQPKEGDVILFPHYLMHTAYPFKSSGERRSFSFNLEIDKKIANVFSR